MPPKHGLGGARGAALACTAAFILYLSLSLIAHYALRTNAFDLSVFDYALWTTASGGPVGFVPMMRGSLFAQHWMPTLLLLAPFSLVFDSPTYLIVLQTAFFAVAGFLLFQFASRYVPRRIAWALLVAFLLSRRSHSALRSFFYIESAEPMLIFGALLAWSHRRMLLYGALIVLALGCKEDVALYLLPFGIVLMLTGDRAVGKATAAVASTWLVLTMFVVIPYWHLSGTSWSYNYLEGRYQLGQGAVSISRLIGRTFSLNSLGTLVTISSATGFLCWLSPWMWIAIPGVFLNLVAQPGTLQSSLIGHYLWPVMPWLFVAAVFGAHRIPLALSASRWLSLAVVLIALIDLPLPRSLAGAPVTDLAAGARVRLQLTELVPTGTVLALPNLIPHLPKRHQQVYGYGVYPEVQPIGDYVLFTQVGDLWPLDSAGVEREVSKFAADPAYEQVMNGPLFAFKKR